MAAVGTRRCFAPTIGALTPSGATGLVDTGPTPYTAEVSLAVAFSNKAALAEPAKARAAEDLPLLQSHTAPANHRRLMAWILALSQQARALQACLLAA